MSDPIGEIRGMEPKLKAKLEAEGITNTQHLLEHAHTEHLHKTLEEIHTSKKLSQRAPTLSEVNDWVAQAKKLAPSSPE